MLYEMSFWICLAVAAYCDHRTKEVYDMIFIPSILFGAGILAINKEWNILISVGIFTLFQVIIFARLYGGADCFAFVMCAMYMAIHDYKMIDFLIILMAGTFFLAFIVQATEKNINKKGNLKESIALIPYILLNMTSWKIVEMLGC